EAGALLLAAVAEPVEGHLQRHLDAGRAVVGIEHARQRGAAGLARGDGQQPLGQLDGRGVREAGQDHLFQAAGLAGAGPRDARPGWRGAMASSRSASSMAGACEKPARITCSRLRAWRAMASAMRGSAWPWRLVHQLLTPSR